MCWLAPRGRAETDIYYLNYCMLCVYFDWCYNLLDVNFTTVFITLFIDIKNECVLSSADVSLKCLSYFLVIFHRCVKFHSV
jgi:hypothetical protein